MELSKFPSPIAIAYLSAVETEDPQMKFRALIKAFGVLLKYCAFITINDYLRLREQEEITFPSIDKRIVDNIEKPSLGHWNELLREILKEFSDKRSLLFMPELFNFYFDIKQDKIKPQKSVTIIDELIFIRNYYVHPDIYPDSSKIISLCEEYLYRLDYLINELSFLPEYVLTKFYLKDEIEEKCTGNTSEVKKTHQQLLFYLKTEKQSNKLFFNNFIYSHSRHTEGKNGVLLYEALQGKKIKYVLCNFDIMICDAEFENFKPVASLRKLIETIKPKDKQKYSSDESTWAFNAITINWEIFLDLSQKVSKSTYDKFIQEGKFSYKVYVEREKINEHISNFISGEKKVLTIVGESGYGKTNILCDSYKNIIKDGNAVFFLYGREYDGNGLNSFILHKISEADLQIKKILSTNQENLFESIVIKSENISKNRKIVILIDAVNEFPNPEFFIRDILLFLDRVDDPKIKIIFTIRDFAWNNIYDKIIIDASKFYCILDENNRFEPFVKVQKFSEYELNKAYKLYQEKYQILSDYINLSIESKDFLANPLLLRFAAEAYSGQVLPNKIFTAKVFEQFQKEKINSKDYFFIGYLIEAMIILREDYICGSFILKSPDAIEKSNLLLNVPARFSNNGEILSTLLEEYIFGEPVYEIDSIPICINQACPDYGIQILNTQSSLKCLNCDEPLGTQKIDLRTTYTRLKSENLIQELQLTDDFSIRFTYDLMFEYFVGKYYSNFVLKDLVTQKELLFITIDNVKDNFVFWGAIKNVLLEYLRREDIEFSFWCDIIKQSAINNNLQNKYTESHSVFSQVFSASIIEFYIEDSLKTLKLLFYITDNKRASYDTMKFAISCMVNILSESKGLSISSPEIVLLDRGLRFDNKDIIDDTAVVLASLYINNREIIFHFLDTLTLEIRKNLQYTKVPFLILPLRRKKIINIINAYLDIVLLMLGAHYSEKKLKEFIFKSFNDILHSNMSFLVKSLCLNFMPSKFSKIYWEKGFPCNYIEMYLCLNTVDKGILNFVGELFIDSENKRLCNYRENLLEYSKIENGLLSWYIYSLIPIYGQQPSQQDEVLDLIKDMYESGNHISKYISYYSLWILSEFSESSHEQYSKMFEEYSLRFISDFGAYISYNHNVNIDSTLQKYFDEKSTDLQRKVFFGKFENGNVNIKYDNSALFLNIYYHNNKKSTQNYEFIVNLVKSKINTDNEFVAYAIMTLGQTGYRNPSAVLNTIQAIMEFVDITGTYVIFEGKTQCLKDIVIDSLLNIKSYYPKQVIHFIDQMDSKIRNDFKEVKVKEVPKQTNYLYSYYGETIYEKTFLIEKGAREFFGKGIIASSLVHNVDMLFKSFALQFFHRFY